MKFYAGRGDAQMYEELMLLLDRSFEFENSEKGFLTLLPKLYKSEYDPCSQNYVVRTSDGKLKAAVGAYDSEQTVAGVKLKTRGVGNVCVIHDARNEGFMNLLMNKAVDEMAADRVDLSALGGRRMRYRYFSYDCAGPYYKFNFEANDLKHYFGSAHGNQLSFTEINSPDAPELAEMKALYESQQLTSARGGLTRFYDTLKSWRESVFAARNIEDGKLAGYSVGHTNINELILTDENYLDQYIHGYMKARQTDSLRIALPYYKKKTASRLIDYTSHVSLENSERFTILNYKNVINAYLLLAATETELADGQITLLIHGRAGDERLRIAVSGGLPCIETVTAEADLELSHFDAINLLFSAVSTAREKLPPAPKSWLPLSLYTYRADAV